MKIRYIRKDWHTWFAWKPVEVDEYIIWLESIQRQQINTCHGIVSLYRLGANNATKQTT